MTTRFSRTAGALTVAALLGLAAACGGSGGGVTAKSTPPADRVLHLSFLQDPGQPPDPDIYYSGQGLLLTTNLYEGLLKYQPGTAEPKIVASLAESWSASKDNQTFTLKLRKGVVFHDGTPFTAAAVKPSFDRRLAVNQGPAYMVSDVASVTTSGDYEVTIKLKTPDASFLDYLASAYGPKMMSPKAMAANSGKDHLQTYLQTHDVGTGAYTLTDAKVGSHYAMKAFDQYWGGKPYFTSVDIPVQTDASTQQLLFNKGQLAAIVHDLPASAVKSYLKDGITKTYSLPTMMSDYLYLNPNSGFLKDKAARVALNQAIDIDQIQKQVFEGRATKAAQAYPAHMMADGKALQGVTHDTAPLQKLVASLPPAQRTITIGYDSVSPDNQTVANLMSAQYSALGLTAKVQAYPTATIFGWISDPKGAPDMLVTLGWPDAATPYTWSHISFSADGGLNYLHCSDPEITKLLPENKRTGSEASSTRVGELSAATGCWYNLVNQNDFMVAQPWLKGVQESHLVTQPNTLTLAGLSVG
jgi:peptide/nickel transport system substrate-binding protein